MATRFRRGELLVELVAACALLAAGITAITPFLVASHRAQSARDLRETGRMAADHGMELLFSMPFDELDTARATQLVNERLQPDESLTVSINVRDEPGSPLAKRVQIDVTARDRAERFRPIVLSAWRFAPPRPAVP